MDNHRTIRVMIVDDHLMVRDGLKVFLSQYADLEVVAEAEDGMDLLVQLASAEPDVILIDMMMPRMAGPEAIAEVRRLQPDVQLIGLTSFDQQGLVQEAIAAGAIGFLFKDVHADMLAQAIRNAANGRGTVDAKSAHALITSAQADALGQDLTRREREVLALLVNGATNKAIGSALTISQATVRLHVSNILSKLHVSNRTEAASVALQNHLIQ